MNRRIVTGDIMISQKDIHNFNISIKAIILKRMILSSLKEQGFKVDGKLLIENTEKDFFRKLQENAKMEQIRKHINFLIKYKKLAYKYALNGNEIDPKKIDLDIIEVLPNSTEEKLFRWWNFIWWSIPYQQPYGRQMRFLIWDKGHNAPFGLISLQSPVLKMAVRDKALGIPKSELDIWVNKSLNAQRVGALPPYNELLGGKMVALTLASNEIREAYRKKYKGYISIIKGRHIEPELLFITTTSAFGKSSIYNRLKYKGEIVAESLGFTKGYGSFHISDEIYKRILDYLTDLGYDVSRSYGDGPSKKMKILRMGFEKLGLPNYHRHGVAREFFLFSHVNNLKDVIQKKASPKWKDRSFIDLMEFWRERWLIPRAKRVKRYKNFNKYSYFVEVERILEGCNE